ncbi:hypothetical protein F4805DRAFT_454449 [Annulohypoxylon moriforme]|nr:hypothetical protein F4805DRAFT_454449 [Annulohypoxylon moriforme]
MATIHVFKTAETKLGADPDFGDIKDSGLSEKGLDQCLEFSAHSEFLPSMQYVTHVVSSPLRSSIYSCRIALDRVVSSQSITVLSQLMDVGFPIPSFGTNTVQLFLEFADQIDRSNLPSNWMSTTPGGASEYDLEKIKARTKAAREWLMELARTAGEKAHIVVMTHGLTAHLVTDDFQGVEPPNYEANWDGDLSWRSYKFDFDAKKMVEIPSSLERRRVENTNVLTDDENAGLREVIEDRIERYAPFIQEYQDFHREAEKIRKAEKKAIEDMERLTL